MEYRLEDICISLVRGPFGSALKKEFFIDKTEETYKVYEQGNAIRKNTEYGEYHIDKDKYQELKRFEVKPLDFIMSCSGTIGELYQLPREAEKGVINQALLKMTVNSEIVDYNFFRYIFLNNLSQLESKGSGIKNVASVKVLKELRFDIPLLNEQKKIVKKLNNVNCMIERRNNQLLEFDNLIKSRFVEMFGEIVSNSRGWNIDVLDNQIEVIGGFAFKSDMFVDSGIPVLKIGNINAGYFKPTNLMFWVEDGKLERYEINPGDLVISLTGTVGKDDYGNVCIMGDEYAKYYLNQRNAKLDLKYTLDKYYLTYALKVPDIKKKLTGISRGVRQANISNKDIQNLELPIPPIDIQNQFATFVQQVDKLKVDVQKSLDETKMLFDSLMQKYFE